MMKHEMVQLSIEALYFSIDLLRNFEGNDILIT